MYKRRKIKLLIIQKAGWKLVTFKYPQTSYFLRLTSPETRDICLIFHTKAALRC